MRKTLALSVIVIVICGVLGSCASEKSQLGNREMATLEPFPTEIVYISPDAEINPPLLGGASGTSALGLGLAFLYATSAAHGGGSGGAVGVNNGGVTHTSNAYISFRAELRDNLKNAGDLHFNQQILGDVQNLISRSAWLSKAKLQILPAMDMQDLPDMDAAKLSDMTSGDVVIVLVGHVEMPMDGSGLGEALDMIIYTRNQNHRLTEYKRHSFSGSSDSPIKPVSVYQKDTHEWSEIKPIKVEDYLQNWFGDGQANLKEAFASDNKEVSGDLYAYLGVSPGDN